VPIDNAINGRFAAHLRGCLESHSSTDPLDAGNAGPGRGVSGAPAGPARRSAAASKADPLANVFDVLAVNTYNGWYGPDAPKGLAKIEWRMPKDKPLIFSELGAAARAGLHQPDEPHKFSEEYQAEYYRTTLAMAARIPTLAGMSPWILKDFRSPRRQRPGVQDGWNRKGLISETGQRKLAFGVLARWYATIAVREKGAGKGE
jgi:hypothetical protein